MDNKKILIIYATAGAGHKKAAQALYALAKKDGLNAQLADVTDFMPYFLKRLYSDGYIFLISRLAWLWGGLYFLSDTPILSFLNVHFRKFANRLALVGFLDFLKDEQFDIVISTQFLASEIVSYGKQKLKLKTKLITVVTDFGVHNFWISQGTDVYCCAAPSTKLILERKGVPAEKIKITGIPIDEKFTMQPDKNALISELGIKDGFTVLIATGGIGAGPIEEIVDSLKEDAQLLVVCGYNKNLYDRLSKKKCDNVRLFEFVDFMDKLMGVSDCIVTKAGGLSVTESLARGLPMIYFFLLPGQEMINAETLSGLGAGVITTQLLQIKEQVLKFKNNPEELAVLKDKCLSLAKPDSCRQIILL